MRRDLGMRQPMEFLCKIDAGETAESLKCCRVIKKVKRESNHDNFQTFDLEFMLIKFCYLIKVQSKKKEKKDSSLSVLSQPALSSKIMNIGISRVLSVQVPWLSPTDSTL